MAIDQVDRTVLELIVPWAGRISPREPAWPRAPDRVAVPARAGPRPQTA